MPGKQKAHPIPAATYAGFAASPPNEPAAPGPELRLNGEARVYAREELRRRSARRRRAPIAAAAVLAVVVAGAAITIGLGYNPMSSLRALHRPAEPALSEVSLPPVAPPSQPQAAQAPSPPLAADTPTAGEPVQIADLPPAGPVVTAAKPTPRPAPRATVAAGKPSVDKARSSAQAAADRAATDRVSALAALDQKVNEAYAAALNAGAPVGPLAESQENWVIRRDRVRREDPDMAEDIARARIAELRGIAAKSGQAGSSGAAEIR